MAECACASLILTSFTDVPSLVCTVPEYLNWSISSSVCPFICVLLDGLGLMLLTRILLMSELISMPCSAAVPSSLWVSGCNSSSQIDAIGKPQVAKQSSSNGHFWQRSVRFFCLFCCTICKAVILRWIPAVTFSRTILNRSFLYSAPILWNSLPPDFRRHNDNGSPGTNILSKSTFMSKLKTHFFHKSYPASSESASSITSSRSNPSYLLSPSPPDYHQCMDYQTHHQRPRLSFLLYCMTLRYLPCSGSNTTAKNHVDISHYIVDYGLFTFY